MIRKFVGLRIKELRAQRHLSQEKCALSAGIDRTYLASVELGHRNISIINLNKICESFGVSLKSFFDSDIFNGENK